MENPEKNNIPTEQVSMEFWLILVVSILFPPILLFGFFVVNPREEIVVIRFGKYIKTINSEGIRWIHPVGRVLRRISTQDTTLHINTSTVVERNGTPILISAVVVYRVEDTRKAALDVLDFSRFITDQTGAVVKRVSSLFPYESSDHSEPCLKTENEKVTQAYIYELQKVLEPSGARVLGFRLNDLTYAPEIAQAMLMRQQALALIDARKVIVEGAVSIVKDAIDRLRAAGLEVKPEQQEQLVSNLLVVLCSGERAQPVLQVQSNRSHS
jgi:regulator of protease activity HflC (stomatin/prohibitin superfamily)